MNFDEQVQEALNNQSQQTTDTETNLETTQTETETTTTIQETTEKPDEVLSWLKENGHEFASRDDIKPLLEKGKNYDNEINKYKSFETKSAELEAKDSEWKQKFEYVKSLNDPASLGISEDEQRAFLLRKQRPDLDPNTLVQVMTKDLSKLSHTDVLKLKLKLNDSDVYSNESQVKAAIEDDYGIDLEIPFDEYDELAQIKIKKAAKEAIKEFNTLKMEVKLPEKVDFDALLNSKQSEAKDAFEQRSKQWEPVLRDFSNQLDKYVVTEDGKAIFEYVIDEDFKKTFSGDAEQLRNQALQMEFSEENRQNLIGLQKEIYFLQNKSKILKAYAAQEVTKRELELKAEYHNPKNPNQAIESRVSSQDQSNEQFNAAIMKGLGY